METENRTAQAPGPRGVRATVARILDIATQMTHSLATIATAEAKAVGARIGIGAGLFVLAVVGLGISFLFLSLAAWWALGLLIGNALSGLVVGVLWILIAAGLVIASAKTVTGAHGFPETRAAIRDLSAEFGSDDEGRNSNA